MNVGPPTAEVSGAPGLTKPPGMPRSTTGPKAPEGFKSEGVPDQTFLQTQKVLLEAANLLKGEGAEEEKPKATEAESIKLPDFPNPETYRSWKTAAREAIRAASDKSDEASQWIFEVYDNSFWRENVQDPKKFFTFGTSCLNEGCQG